MEVSADLSVLLVTQEWAKSLEALPEELRARGFEPLSIFTLQVAEETVASSVEDCLPPAASWVGSAEIGFTEMGLGAPAVWRADSGL